MPVHSLSREDPLEQEMETHSSLPAWKISWTQETGGLLSMGPQSDMTERLTIHTYTELSHLEATLTWQPE